LFRQIAQRAALGGAAVAALSSWRTEDATCHGTSLTGTKLIDKVAVLEQKLYMLESRLANKGVETVTGQGDAVFSWDEHLTDVFPAECLPFQKDMHGGFNEDVETGIVYTGIPGAGLFSISQDLKTWTSLGTDERLKGNIHGIVVFKHDGETQIAVAQNDDQRVLIIGIDGTVKQQLDKPQGGEFAFNEANGYYSARRHKSKAVCKDGNTRNVFACTDVTFLDGKLYVVTGYCDGDFVLTLEKRVAPGKRGGEWQWGKTAWGGKGQGVGQFQTAHGVFAHNGHIYVANREAFEVIKFTPNGNVVDILPGDACFLA
jgi:hypothetical protein